MILRQSLKIILAILMSGTIIGLREDLTSLLDAADISGTYEFSKKSLRPNKSKFAAYSSNQLLAGSLALVTDKQTANAVKEVFNPDVSVQSMRNAKRVLSTVDPEGWKEVKKYVIQGKLDQLTRQTNELGLPAFSDYFSRPNNQKMMQELLEPDEYQNFAKLIDLMDRALKTVPRGGSATQPLLAAEKALGEEVGTSGSAAARLLLGTIRLPGRLASGQVFDETLNAIKMKQMETYYEALASVLFDPNAAKTIDDAYKYFDKIDFGIKQGGVQGVREGVDATSDYIDKDGAYDPSEEDIERMRREMDALGSSQKPMSKEADVPIFNPLPSMGGGMSSMGIPGATVLPSEQDRELAERLRQAKSGIGGLAV
jgi:hypothetical protein